jgi:hypothetical protein
MAHCPASAGPAAHFALASQCAMPLATPLTQTLGRTNNTMQLVAHHIELPETATFPGFILRMLSPELANQDFAAVTASAHSIRHVFGPDNDWPSERITFSENEADLARHAREFNERLAFAYALLDLPCARYLGCLYLKPIKSKTGRDQRHERFDAQAFLWLSVLHQDVSEPEVQAVVSEWLSAKWGLARVAWPGHSPSWDEWKQLSSRPVGAA